MRFKTEKGVEMLPSLNDFYHPPRPQRTPRSVRLLSYVALFSVAVTISLILPTPWAILDASTIAFKHRHRHTAPPEWKDDTWPLREPTPWDISTNFSYPRKLEYDVQEGTWLRLDVNPVVGDIVFDMVGDIYCLPGHEVSETLSTSTLSESIKARPVLLGVPHDSDPHFSPSGDRLVFRSDAELGVENIWVMEWHGCENMDIRSQNQSAIRGLEEALKRQVDEEKMLATGVFEDAERRYNRLVREGRWPAKRVTNETYRWISDARFHPIRDEVIATKWYTSERSLGAGEGWAYPVPSVKELHHEGQRKVRAGSGKKLIGRSLPLGWTISDYGQQQIGPEQHIWHGHDSIIYSKNVMDSSMFTYSKDVHSGIYAIFQHNLTTGVTDLLVDSFPGGSSRPELSRDGRTLAFVRRVRDKEALVLKDLQTGSIHNVWHGLTYDLSAISAPMGTYPSFAFMPDDSAVIIWAAGQIYHVPLSTNSQGERIASTHAPHPIRFTAHIEKHLANTLTGGADIVHFETQETEQVRALSGLRVDYHGSKAVFQAAGLTYWQEIGTKSSKRVPVLDQEAAYYSPSFVFGSHNLVIHARWSDSSYTTFELADMPNNTAYELEGLSLGRYYSPVVCESFGNRRTIAFAKSGGDPFSGDILATAGVGLYIAEITLPSLGSSSVDTKIQIENLRHVPSEINTYDRLNMRFLNGNEQLMVQQSFTAFIIDLTSKADATGKRKHIPLASGRMSSELAVSPRSTKKGKIHAENVAFVDFFHVYIAPGSKLKKGESVWSGPSDATKGLARLSLDGGHDITWSGDGQTLFWFLGPYLHSLEVSKLHQCSSEIHRDRNTFGMQCVINLLAFQEVQIHHPTDIARLKRDARGKSAPSALDNADVVVIMNATILTMETGQVETDLIPEGTMVIRGGVIESVGATGSAFRAPVGASVIDAAGAFVIPGFIDVHAHWSGFAGRFPAKSWEMETFLAYGVTTLHNPSADNVAGFAERSRVERGQMVGPRIFTVGDIIYGAGAGGIHQDIVDMEEARSALLRIKVEGGPASISYKNYNLPSRASRQRLLKIAEEMEMLCVPEGGMNYDWDLTYITDGMTTVEHAIPVPTLYEDVLTLFALSGTGSTPTHIVNYGGAWGEQLVWATEDIPNDPKLRRFTRHDLLEALTESTARPFNSYALFNTSESVAKMVAKGLLANIGAHGEPPLGVNYHAEMSFAARGGLTNYQVIQAATASGAKTLGIFGSLGSLTPGKLADFLIYAPHVDLLEGEIGQKTRQLNFVSRGSRIWDANTMVEVWPLEGKKQTMPVINAE